MNDQNVVFDQEPVIVDGRTLVPFRAIFEALDVPVGWDGATQTVSGVHNGTDIRLGINQRTAYVNNRTIAFDVPPQVMNGRTLVPLRFFENTGLGIAWDAENRQVNMEGHVSSDIGSDTPVADDQPANGDLVNGLTLDEQLFDAVSRGYADEAFALAQAGADVNYMDPQFRNTPLQHAAAGNHAELTALMLEKGADPNHILDVTSRESILTYVAGLGDHEKPDLEVFEALLNAGADPNHRLAQTFGRQSALDIAASASYMNDAVHRSPDQNLVALLLRYGADPSGGDALYRAIQTESMGIVRFLLDHGAPVNVDIAITSDYRGARQEIWTEEMIDLFAGY